MKITIHEGDWLKDDFFGYYCTIHKMVLGHMFADLNSFQLHLILDINTIKNYVETEYEITGVDVTQHSTCVTIRRDDK